MDIYDVIMKPFEALLLRELRSLLMPQAEGSVLEIGIGTGANLGYYDFSKINSFTAFDLELSKELAGNKINNFNFVAGHIEDMPFENGSFDAVVATLILCTVNIDKSLSEIKRVLRPGGKFIFIEHVRPHGKLIGRMADTLNNFWPKLANGCNLNRRTDVVLQESGFEQLDIHSRWGGAFSYGSAQLGGG